MARIFVIDDDDQLLRMVGLMLERGGHTATLINNPREGLEQIKADPPDLAVLDVMMPNMNGHDLTRRIRNTDGLKDLPILILTARSQDIDRTAALKSGANAYLSKPVTSQELMSQIDDLLTKETDHVAPEQGIIIALYGLRGGIGCTTLAVNLAAALRRLSQQEVCLMDLTPSGGQALMHMRLQARSGWFDLLEGDIEWSILKDKMTIHQSGLRLLPAPASPHPPDALTTAQTETILKLLREHAVFTVVDMPSVLSPSFQATLKTADMALHVVSPDVITVQTAVQANRVLKKMGLHPKFKSHILNQTTPNAALSQAAIERGLNARIAFNVEYDKNQPRALAQGVPLTLTSAKSSLPTVVRRMAKVIWKRVAQQSSAKEP